MGLGHPLHLIDLLTNSDFDDGRRCGYKIGRFDYRVFAGHSFLCGSTDPNGVVVVRIAVISCAFVKNGTLSG